MTHNSYIKVVSGLFIFFPVYLLHISFAKDLGGDWFSYQMDYAQPFIKEPVYSAVRAVFAGLGVEYIIFHSLHCIVQFLLITYLSCKFRVSYGTYLLTIIYFAAVFWIAHFRASHTLYGGLFLSSPLVLLSIASLFHFGNLIPLVFAFTTRYKKLAFISIFIFFLLAGNQLQPLLLELAVSVGRQRFYDSIFDPNYTAFEHRSIFQLSNPKIWMSVLMTYLLWHKSDHKILGALFSSQYLLYIVLSFDAYLAQKVFLNLSVFMFLQPSVINKNYRLIATITVMLMMIMGIFGRWIVFFS